MKQKYPKSLQIVIKEAPLAYGILAIDEWKNKFKTAAQILRDWQKHKKEHESNLFQAVRV